MAGHLLAAGHDVNVWNRTKSVSEKWALEYKGQASDSIEAAVKGADFVMMCVGQDKDVLDVAGKAIPAMRSGAVFVDHTTASDDCAKQVGAMCARADIGFLDAPISGGEAGAVNGQLTVMCGGDTAHFAAAEPIIDAYAKAMDNRASTMAKGEYEFGFAVDWMRSHGISRWLLRRCAGDGRESLGYEQFIGAFESGGLAS